jgi:LacI family transcriptional regulator
VTTELDIARKRVTLSDIAKDLGLSVNAVSGVLNGRDNVRVGEATRKAILASARKLGYRRNVGASVLAGGKTRSIGLLVADIRNAFSAPVAGAFEEEASRLGYQCILGCTQYDGIRKVAYIERFLSHQIDGLMLTTIWQDLDVQRALRSVLSEKIPVVFVDYPWKDMPGSIVCGNHFQGGHVLGRHLIEMGHRNMIYVGDCRSMGVHSVEQRVQGLRSAFSEAGLPLDSIIIDVFNYQYGLGEWVTGFISSVRSRNRPSVLVTTNDCDAYRMYTELRSRGIRVPDDIALAGYDDLGHFLLGSIGMNEAQLPFLMGFPLTTIRQPLTSIGNEAARVLIDAIEGKGKDWPVNRELDVELIVRESSRLPLWAR